MVLCSPDGDAQRFIFDLPNCPSSMEAEWRSAQSAAGHLEARAAPRGVIFCDCSGVLSRGELAYPVIWIPRERNRATDALARLGRRAWGAALHLPAPPPPPPARTAVAVRTPNRQIASATPVPAGPFRGSADTPAKVSDRVIALLVQGGGRSLPDLLAGLPEVAEQRVYDAMRSKAQHFRVGPDGLLCLAEIPDAARLEQNRQDITDLFARRWGRPSPAAWPPPRMPTVREVVVAEVEDRLRRAGFCRLDQVVAGVRPVDLRETAVTARGALRWFRHQYSVVEVSEGGRLLLLPRSGSRPLEPECLLAIWCELFPGAPAPDIRRQRPASPLKWLKRRVRGLPPSSCVVDGSALPVASAQNGRAGREDAIASLRALCARQGARRRDLGLHPPAPTVPRYLENAVPGCDDCLVGVSDPWSLLGLDPPEGRAAAAQGLLHLRRVGRREFVLSQDIGRILQDRTSLTAVLAERLISSLEASTLLGLNLASVRFLKEHGHLRSAGIAGSRYVTWDFFRRGDVEALQGRWGELRLQAAGQAVADAAVPSCAGGAASQAEGMGDARPDP